MTFFTSAFDLSRVLSSPYIWSSKRTASTSPLSTTCAEMKGPSSMIALICSGVFFRPSAMARRRLP